MTLTLEDIPADVDAELQKRASEQCRDLKSVAVEAIQAGLGLTGKRPLPPQTLGELYAAIRRRVDPIGGIELELPPREPMRDPPDFSDDSAGY